MHKTAYVEYRPLGVLGVIAPWNYPFHNMFNHVVSVRPPPSPSSSSLVLLLLLLPLRIRLAIDQ